MEDTPLWQRCEHYWAGWLTAYGWAVDRLSSISHNMPHTGAHLIQLPGKAGVATSPDLLASKAGQRQYWEVKSRLQPSIQPSMKASYPWITLLNYYNYQRVQYHTGTPVYIALYEYYPPAMSWAWYTIALQTIMQHTIRDSYIDEHGQRIRIIRWKHALMTPVPGMHTDLSTTSSHTLMAPAVSIRPEFADEPLQTPVSVPSHTTTKRPKTPKIADTRPSSAFPHTTISPKNTDTTDVHTTLPSPVPLIDTTQQPIALPPTRTPPPLPSADNTLPPRRSIQSHGTEDQIRRDTSLALVMHQINLPYTPRYSVLYIGTTHVDDVLALLDFGIRVFLITAPQSLTLTPRLRAFQEARLLELAVISQVVSNYHYWHIDGRAIGPEPHWHRNILTLADDTGQINMAQYAIVHAPIDQDVLVTAGAGSGKTETMSERLIFILSTATPMGYQPTAKPYQLRISEIGLITFTRDAAREMRSRIARAITIRQRLARSPVQPTLDWLLQLGQTNISTIHAFAKMLLKHHGSQFGLAPEFRVSQQAWHWHRLALAALATPLPTLYQKFPNITPAAYEWSKHIRTIWEALENNGVPLMNFNRQHTLDLSTIIDWGDANYVNDPEFVETTHSIIQHIRQTFQDHCQREQVLPTNQLVPTAITALKQLHPLPLKYPLRYVFVDEFQDTDSLQLDLILTLRQQFHTRLFVVGDTKQGVYRFRGAQGNAFDVLHQRMQHLQLPAFAMYSLNRNFRSDGVLLESLHRYFAAWGHHRLLQYQPHDRLKPRQEVQRAGTPISFQTVQRKTDYPHLAAQQVIAWRKAHPTDSIAVLCRTNAQAFDVQQAVRRLGANCALLVGGGFFQSPVVRELRVLLEALANPHDDASILELCATRWAHGLFHCAVPHPLCDDQAAWGDIPEVLDWNSRLRIFDHTGSFPHHDLDLLRRRLISLASLTQSMAGMSLIVICRDLLAPEMCAFNVVDDDNERRRYARGLTHLITLLDDAFVDAPVTLGTILEWVRLNIQTNYSEDEPSEPDDIEGTTTALTVHKSKGLEFDHVLIPHTWKKTESTQKGTEVAIQIQTSPQGTQQYQLRWRWHHKEQQFSNTTTQDTSFWDVDTQETICEETRLLYVAMTRARHTLHVFRSTDDHPHTWNDLFRLGEHHDQQH